MFSHIESGVVEGTWEEIALHATEFNGRRLRVTILPDAPLTSANERLAALDAWLNLPRPEVVTPLDDSRAGIYGEGRG